MVSIDKCEGSYFGEWTLVDEHVDYLIITAVGNVVYAILTKEKFDADIGPLMKVSQDDVKSEDYTMDLAEKDVKSFDCQLLGGFSSLKWSGTRMYFTDYSETGLVSLGGSESLLSLKRFSKKKIKKLGKEAQVLKEKNLMKIVNPSACVPQVLSTSADQTHAVILLSTCIACPIASVLNNPLDDTCARFCAASVVIALEHLHKVYFMLLQLKVVMHLSRFSSCILYSTSIIFHIGVLYRGVSPNVLMLDQTGHVQVGGVVDFNTAFDLSISAHIYIYYALP